MVDFIAYDMNNNVTYMGIPSQEKQAGFFSIENYIQIKTPTMTRGITLDEVGMESIIQLYLLARDAKKLEPEPKKLNINQVIAIEEIPVSRLNEFDKHYQA